MVTDAHSPGLRMVQGTWEGLQIHLLKPLLQPWHRCPFSALSWSLRNLVPRLLASVTSGSRGCADSLWQRLFGPLPSPCPPLLLYPSGINNRAPNNRRPDGKPENQHKRSQDPGSGVGERKAQKGYVQWEGKTGGPKGRTFPPSYKTVAMLEREVWFGASGESGAGN